jgi:hypothetical protein
MAEPPRRLARSSWTQATLEHVIVQRQRHGVGTASCCFLPKRRNAPREPFCQDAVHPRFVRLALRASRLSRQRLGHLTLPRSSTSGGVPPEKAIAAFGAASRAKHSPTGDTDLFVHPISAYCCQCPGSRANACRPVRRGTSTPPTFCSLPADRSSLPAIVTRSVIRSTILVQLQHVRAI